MSTNKKVELANEFRRRYGNDPVGFKKFVRSEGILVPGDCAQTWEYLEEGARSLERGSNMGLLVS